MKQATLCLLVKENQNKRELLLAMKKRGFGMGKWNGVGGKIDLEKVAVLSFYFPYNQAWNQDVHVFLVKNWKGEPKESEEMLPKWFKIEELPFEQMWDDDRFWLPQVLEGKKLKAKFIFREGEKISGKNVELVENI